MMKALSYTSLNYLTRIATGPVLLLLIPFFLTGEEQGYWYTMSSLIAFIAFADMGLSTILIHNAAFEHGKLERALYIGDRALVKRHEVRLAALQKFAKRRAKTVSVIVGSLVLLTGLYFLGNEDESTSWKIPWTIFCISSAMSLTLTILLSSLEGCDAVADMQRVRALIAFVNLIVLAVGLVLDIGIWALPLASGISTLVGFGLSRNYTRGEFKELDGHTSVQMNIEVDAWKKETSHLLPRYAASWFGGYVMFQLFTPITFRVEGAEVAGQVGLTISLFTAIYTLSSVWTTYQLPSFAIAIAKKERATLNHCLSMALRGSLITYILVILVFFSTYPIIVKYVPQLSERVLGLEAMLALSGIWFCQLLVNNFAVYLRAFKEEPLAGLTLLAAVHSFLSTLAILFFWGIGHIFWGLLSVYFWLVPSVLYLFIRKFSITKLWGN